MLRLVAFFAVVALTYDTPRVHSSQPQLGKRIVGGKDANIEDFPFQVSLQLDGSHYCGGSIISPTFIITAAHCTGNGPAKFFKVRVGSSCKSKGGELVSVKNIHLNPSFNSLTFDYDISILELAEPLQYGHGVQPVKIADVRPDDGSMSNCTGWGYTGEDARCSDQLQSVELPIVNQEECRRAYGTLIITDRMICAGFPKGGKDACAGDSGGPLVVDGILVGIVSFGKSCAVAGFPGVYADVANLCSFITQVTGL